MIDVTRTYTTHAPYPFYQLLTNGAPEVIPTAIPDFDFTEAMRALGVVMETVTGTSTNLPASQVPRPTPRAPLPAPAPVVPAPRAPYLDPTKGVQRRIAR